ncbi:hypothetical protein [Salinibacterium sp. TMP30]|uniref:hypothetical protein n=1 Tax=Salinibacterium sp. TMP30 TaxID=3138237 RepID=UPI00313885BD
MSGSERVESAETVSGAGTGSESGFGSAMAACLREQAVHEPHGRLARIFGVNPLSASAGEFYSAALGELETAVALSALGPDWMVAHSTLSANDHVSADHLVLGPSGAFLVCGRLHAHSRIVTAGRMVMVNGRRVAYVRDAMVGAERMTAALANLGAASITVRPLVVFVGASGVIYGRMRAPVPVLQLGELVRWLLYEPTVYSAAEVNALVAVAGRLESWHGQPAAGSASVRLTARFERLRTEVDAARQRYRLWVVAGGTAAIAATVTVLVLVAPAIAGVFSG